MPKVEADDAALLYSLTDVCKHNALSDILIIMGIDVVSDALVVAIFERSFTNNCI